MGVDLEDVEALPVDDHLFDSRVGQDAKRRDTLAEANAGIAILKLEGLKQLLAADGQLVDKELAEAHFLQAILKHHVVSGKVMSGTAVKLSEAATLNGTKLPLKFDAKAKKLHVGAGTVVAADIEAKNGVIHVVDTVLPTK